MPNYPGRRKGTRRVVIWANGAPNEWIIEGTKADGDAFEARKRIELGKSGASQKNAAPLSEIFKAYAIHAESHLKASTWKKVRIYQIATLRACFDRIKSDKLTVGHVDAFKRQRLADVMDSSVNNELRVFRKILNWAKKNGYVVSDVEWERLKERGSDRVQFWTRDELDRIFDACRELHPPLLPMLVFLANTGCRKGEAMAANWSWLNFDAGVITIPASREWQPKSGRSRDVPMSDAVRAVLSGQREHNTIVFPTRRGNRRYTNFPKDIFWEILAAAKIEGNPHMFRHTFASEFLAATKDMPLLADILGHSTTRITEIYAHLLPGRLDRAMNAVNLAPRTMAQPWRAEPGEQKKARKKA